MLRLFEIYSYPILDITQKPETIDVVLINRQELPPTGAGEGSMRPVAAAVANAIYDATGIRIRQAPFTPERIRAGLARVLLKEKTRRRACPAASF